MRERLSDYQEKYGDLFNLEATPAESTTYRFAKHDVEEYPGIVTANMNGTPYYTNSSHLPVGFTEDVFSALDIQDDLQTLYTSGTVFHAFLGEKLPDWRAAANLVRKIAENYKLPYYTLSPTYSVCRDHGYLSGEQYVCPVCGQKTEVYSRITGYYRPVQNWNDGKAQEFRDRKLYDIGRSRLTHAGPRPERSNMDAAIEATMERGCCEPAQVLMKPETEEVKAAEAEKRAESAVKATQAEPAPQTKVSPIGQVSAEDLHEALEGAEAILFKSPTCPNCKAAMALLDRAGVKYAAVNAADARALTEKYGVRQAPTLVVRTGEGFEKFRGVSDIKGWLMQRV
jgi:ribonucleoside-triphosphate reductase